MCLVLSLLRARLQNSHTKGVLLTAIEVLADVVPAPMPDTVARLDLTGPRPVVWLDPHSSVADLHRVLPEVLAAIVNGPEAARSARQAPKLVAVS